jgi:hypothetical protein
LRRNESANSWRLAGCVPPLSWARVSAKPRSPANLGFPAKVPFLAVASFGLPVTVALRLLIGLASLLSLRAPLS